MGAYEAINVLIVCGERKGRGLMFLTPVREPHEFTQET